MILTTNAFVKRITDFQTSDRLIIATKAGYVKKYDILLYNDEVILISNTGPETLLFATRGVK
ncbi:hypothetical protein Hs30E_14390 [Lactococcus hodotermopsidis]|uniref:Uncharacterized protein n=1 Tax=Pseudolactococcus hodotermopsidis TaxID=2709157 RepID=A0A6A0BEX5_9LACT|nr:hypothetical protein [Lactococcus hodotermopsidis]GFH42888.1 hypothetical protein Hs30E_14390 [Lactococcus hodotermopsidis]